MQDRLAAGSYMRCTELIGPAGRAVFCGTINQGAIQWPRPIAEFRLCNSQPSETCYVCLHWVLAASLAWWRGLAQLH